MPAQRCNLYLEDWGWRWKVFCFYGNILRRQAQYKPDLLPLLDLIRTRLGLWTLGYRYAGMRRAIGTNSRDGLDAWNRDPEASWGRRALGDDDLNVWVLRCSSLASCGSFALWSGS